MLDFFLGELRRFRRAAAAYALANLLGLAVLQQMVDIPNGPVALHVVMAGFYMVTGLILAVFQFGSYRQASRWIWLQHRPVHRARILAALVLAAATLSACAVALPLCTLLLMLQHYTHNVVDARSYAGAAWLALSALTAWLAGGYVMLHRSRWAFVVFVLPAVLTMRLATATTVLGITAACAAVLLALLYTVFRPNRSTADDAVATAASALPLQACIYVALLWGGSMAWQAGLLVAGAHPQAQEPPRPGTYTETRRFNAKEALMAGLAGSKDPRATGWRAWLDGHPAFGLGPLTRQYGVRGIMTGRGMQNFVSRDTLWTFSHDRMRYHGVNLRTRADQGMFGTGGAGSRAPFATVPVGSGGNRGVQWFFDAHNLYRADEAGTRLEHVLHVDGSEQLAGRLVIPGRHMLVPTNSRVVLLTPDARTPAAGTPTAAAEVPLPLPYGDLEHVNAAEVPDGTLVTFVYGHRQADGYPASQQVTYLVDLSARVQEVARREIGHDFAPLFEHRAWWVSPALHALVSLPDLLIDDGTIPDAGVDHFAPLRQARPAAVWAAALAAALLAGVGAAWWAPRAGLGRTARGAWCAACLLLGVPALLSLMILRPRRRTMAAGRAAIYTGGFVNPPRKS
ncbi:hypothetical protein C5614_09050 [Massilia phosphatilytica]|nr:hypothetical protein C5614_09050 [Massilia phosphatilytica]